jgi:hypothetical protein
MGIKDAFLNKGWAGRTMSRQETIEHINPLIRMHHELNHAYRQAINHVSNREVARRLDGFQRTARADIGKLSETVLSAGGVAYNGIDLERGGDRFASEEGALIRNLKDAEEEFHRRLTDELAGNHQIRSRAILSVVQANSRVRLDHLRDVERTFGRSTNSSR